MKEKIQGWASTAVEIAQAIEALDTESQEKKQPADQQAVGVMVSDGGHAVEVLRFVEDLVLDLPATLGHGVELLGADASGAKNWPGTLAELGRRSQVSLANTDLYADRLMMYLDYWENSTAKTLSTKELAERLFEYDSSRLKKRGVATQVRKLLRQEKQWGGS